MRMKSARFQRLWQTLTWVCQGIGETSTYVYAQAKVWVAKRQLGRATRHTGQWTVASWHAISWQALPPQHKVLLAGLGALILLLAIWKIPQWQAASWEERKDIAKLENDARTTLVQAVGGLALLVGLLFTWRNVRATERTSQETLRIAQEGQITERFTRAIDQLGSDKLQIRLGGIYALERIARDSERDYWPIMEVLTAYIREHASTKEDIPHAPQPAQNTPPLPKLATDIQAVLTVLGRRTRTTGEGKDQQLRKGEEQRLNLANTNLEGADLRNAQLQEADLERARLEGADLRSAHLEGANLWEARLEEADLRRAHLKGADLSRAHLEKTLIGAAYLEGANLWGAYLEGASLLNARLEGAALRGTCLKGVDLRRTDLTGTDLKEADLREANLQGAIGLTVEQLSTAKTLYQAHLDPLFLEQIQQQYPHLLGGPRD